MIAVTCNNIESLAKNKQIFFRNVILYRFRYYIIGRTIYIIKWKIKLKFNINLKFYEID